MEAQTMKKHPQRLGKLAKDQNEKLVLVNDNGNVFSTNDAVLLIWQLCTGDKSILEISSDLKEHSDQVDLQDNVCLIIEKLVNAELIELKPQETQKH